MSKTHNTARAAHQDTESPASAFDALPFVDRARRCNWQVEPTDYGTACRRGREYAAQFVEYLREDPQWAGANMLGMIVRDMDLADDSDGKGYAVGFFSLLEEMLLDYARAQDAWGKFEAVERRYRAINAARARERRRMTVSGTGC